MKKFPYDDPDYAFGQHMLNMRMAIGLTQAELGKQLDVSRKAIGKWEAGLTYPHSEHLKAFLTLVVQQQVLPPGEEEETIRSFWNTAHQRVFLDETWLGKLLSPTKSAPTTQPGNETAAEMLLAPQAAHGNPYLDWDDALSIMEFYGREQELQLLSTWILVEHCRVVSVLGQGGIGKSALATRIMRQIAECFEVVIWRSLRDAPSYEALLDSCLRVLVPQMVSDTTTYSEKREDLLLACLRSKRVLLIFDNLESILEQGENAGHLCIGYEGFSRLLQRSAETDHQSCLLLTSREKLSDLVASEGKQSPVRALRLTSLEAEASQQLLAEKGIVGSTPEQLQLIEAYAGNPLALKIVSETIMDLFGGTIEPFLSGGTIIFGGITRLLDEQWTRLSEQEQTVLSWLAILREPVTLADLLAVQVTPLSHGELLEATNRLRRRSLIERGQRAGSFTLQSVILEYVTTKLVFNASEEIQHGHLLRLCEHSFSQAHAKEYIRQAQERLLLVPLLSLLEHIYHGQTAVEAQLHVLFNVLRTWNEEAQGYGPSNLIALLRLLRGHLRGQDLSHMTLRGAFLQGIEMQDASLAETSVYNTVFTESFDGVRSLAISLDGHYWAAGSRRGKVRVWKQEGKTLHHSWQAHNDTVRAVAFSPDGTTLATGSWDGAIKLWNLEYGALLWAQWIPTKIQRIAFAPDGRTIASGGGDAIVRLWDAHSGSPLRTLHSQGRQIQALAWSPDGHLLACGSHDGTIQIWEHPREQPDACVHLFTGHSTWVIGLAFSPDGHILASGSVDQTVKLWDVESERCLQTLIGHTQPVSAIAWSPDGRLLASGGRDPIIWIWDVAASTYRTTLRGHETGTDALSFISDSRHLLCGSDDGTLQVWDIEQGLCIQHKQSYAVSLYDIAWSPDGNMIASAGTDTLVTIWDKTSTTPTHILYGHTRMVHGVAWNQDGSLLATSGWDGTIRIWDVTTATNKHILQDPDHIDAFFFGVDWSPNGKWLANASTIHGVQVWDVEQGIRRWLGQTHAAATRVLWSPDGYKLAACCDNGSVYVWESASGHLLFQLQGHQSIVKNVAWSPDSNHLASSSGQEDNGEIFVWNVHTGQRSHVITGHVGSDSALTWTQENLIVSGGSDGKLCWWDVQSGACLWEQEAHQGMVQALKISPDGKKLASCGDDGTIHIWEAANGNLLLTQRRDRPYERLNISGIKGLTQPQKTSLATLGAIEHAPVRTLKIYEISQHHSNIMYREDKAQPWQGWSDAQ